MLLHTTDNNYKKRRAAMPPNILWEHPDFVWAWIQHWERQQEAARYRLVREVRARTWRQRTPLRRIVGPVVGVAPAIKGRPNSHTACGLCFVAQALCDILHALVSILSRCTHVADRRSRYGTSDIASHSH
jgi:hypothetical protein